MSVSLCICYCTNCTYLTCKSTLRCCRALYGIVKICNTWILLNILSSKVLVLFACHCCLTHKDTKKQQWVLFRRKVCAFSDSSSKKFTFNKQLDTVHRKMWLQAIAQSSVYFLLTCSITAVRYFLLWILQGANYRGSAYTGRPQPAFLTITQTILTTTHKRVKMLECYISNIFWPMPSTREPTTQIFLNRILNCTAVELFSPPCYTLLQMYQEYSYTLTTTYNNMAVVRR